MRGRLVPCPLVKFHQGHPELDPVERPFGRHLRQVLNRLRILADCFIAAVLQSGNLAANGMEPIVVRVELHSALKKRLRAWKRIQADLGLRG